MIGIVRFPEEDGLQSALDHFDETQKRWFQLCIVGGSKCDLSVQARFIREVEDRGDSTLTTEIDRTTGRVTQIAHYPAENETILLTDGVCEKIEEPQERQTKF